MFVFTVCQKAGHRYMLKKIMKDHENLCTELVILTYPKAQLVFGPVFFNPSYAC